MHLKIKFKSKFSSRKKIKKSFYNFTKITNYLRSHDCIVIIIYHLRLTHENFTIKTLVHQTFTLTPKIYFATFFALPLLIHYYLTMIPSRTFQALTRQKISLTLEKCLHF